MATYLDRILAAHREMAAGDARKVDRLVEKALDQPPARGFKRAIEAVVASGDLGVISEVKRRSPKKGPLAPDLDPAALARAYADGGAACLSVLTDEAFFGGSPEDLRAARAAVDLPVLRKDFTVSPRNICDARLIGADAVLLICAALDDSELRDFHALAVEVGLDVLVEIHDEAEADRALEAGAELVGVNQRDLVTFEVDTARAVGLAPRLAEVALSVAESGITGPDAARVLAEAGYHAVLVGESLVRSGDPAKAVTALREAARAR